jgi:hypothetical protein
LVPNADLTGTDLGGADLRGANFATANLTGANLGGALLGYTVFANNTLVQVAGLDACQHFAPSFVDLNAIRLRGVPLSFLRGCGLPDDLIESLSLLSNRSQGFSSCFISYSTKDQLFADRLHSDLQAVGVRCWFAPHDIQGGRKIHEQIGEAIRVYDRLLLILSEHSMNSEWVKTEIAHARQKEQTERRQVLFPISLVPFATVREWRCFDADAGKDSAREIREYFIPDFSDWTAHNSYQEAFQRLVKDFKAKE